VTVALKITTSRFGDLDIEEDRILRMDSGMIGFPDVTRYVLLEHQKGSPFLWLQSVDRSELAFVLTDPLLFKPDYEIDIGAEDMEALGLTNGSREVQTLVVVNLSGAGPKEVTVNLLGPVVVNQSKGLARQVVLYRSTYSHRHPLTAEEMKRETPKAAPQR
jgi:flagellar assembly factor FliW